MTTTYDWPFRETSFFEMRITHNTRGFISPFSSSSQVLNLTGERWVVMVGLPPGINPIDGAAREAFLDRLSGPANRIRLWNLHRPVPLGTLRDGVAVAVINGSASVVNVVNGSGNAVTVVSGSPSTAQAIAVGAGTTVIQTRAGSTLVAGDHVGLPNGQNVRLMANAVADGSGLMPIEFQPRARTAMAAHLPIVWNRPTAEFMNKADGAPTTWQPGMYDSTSLDLIEAP